MPLLYGDNVDPRTVETDPEAKEGDQKADDDDLSPIKHRTCHGLASPGLGQREPCETLAILWMAVACSRVYRYDGASAQGGLLVTFGPDRQDDV